MASPGVPPRWQPLFDRLLLLKASWPMRGFSWDGRFECIASSFPAMHEPKARAAAAEGLPNVWTSSTISKAPPRVQQLSETTGGIRTGQALMVSDAPGGYFAYGLWWPWGDGVSISMRIGLVDVHPAREPFPSFLELFNVIVLTPPGDRGVTGVTQ